MKAFYVNENGSIVSLSEAPRPKNPPTLFKRLSRRTFCPSSPGSQEEFCALVNVDSPETFSKKITERRRIANANLLGELLLRKTGQPAPQRQGRALLLCLMMGSFPDEFFEANKLTETEERIVACATAVRRCAARTMAEKRPFEDAANAFRCFCVFFSKWRKGDRKRLTTQILREYEKIEQDTAQSPKSLGGVLEAELKKSELSRMLGKLVGPEEAKKRLHELKEKQKTRSFENHALLLAHEYLVSGKLDKEDLFYLRAGESICRVCVKPPSMAIDRIESETEPFVDAVREALVLCAHQKHHGEINAALSKEELKEQTDRGLFRFDRLKKTILGIAAGLCSPARDPAIEKILDEPNPGKCKKKILDLLQDMSSDLVRFYIAAGTKKGSTQAGKRENEAHWDKVEAYPRCMEHFLETARSGTLSSAVAALFCRALFSEKELPETLSLDSHRIRVFRKEIEIAIALNVLWACLKKEHGEKTACFLSQLQNTLEKCTCGNFPVKKKILSSYEKTFSAQMPQELERPLEHSSPAFALVRERVKDFVRSTLEQRAVADPGRLGAVAPLSALASSLLGFYRAHLSIHGERYASFYAQTRLP
ncbi:MAG: T-complex protein 11-like protein [Amphiamblys sp. WSBS2006]|nr:MAG: T-complex protein 11-like protein [Amphiamblys sp. WSBS2006]